MFLYVNLITLFNSLLRFPHILGRMNKLEEIDQKYFCAFAVDFYRNQVTIDFLIAISA